MNRVVAVLGAVAVCVILAGCGGSNPCADGCNKQKSCVGNLDCSKVLPAEQAACNLRKSSLSAIDCSKISGDQCTGQAKEAADLINKCTLDPKTCICSP